ncbi:Wzz/FepE/Etk N-terminal domain-containing protein [Hymenobacter rigui]|uniref:Tyrosine kinase G-rich domain-containing protein n=1 Tax=Hymenobacter rigui TaxID=334424 RepID=A0A428K9D3_9BACT|nr:Wzz/FepE/Etk N-terminal domain-containing protein [Hymenobacter rigui]RSK43097.1 hypothetical protein EI291_22325 [Hymenobacter rigui]
MNEFQQNLRLLRPVWRGLPLIALCTVAALALAGLYLRYATPLYESTAKIKLAEGNEGVVNTTLLKTQDVFSPDNRTAAEVELLKSPLLLGKALSRLELGTTVYRRGTLRKTELYHDSPISVHMALRGHRWEDEAFQVMVLSPQSVEVTSPAGETVQGEFNALLHLSEGDVVVEKNLELLAAQPDFPLLDTYEVVRHSPARLQEDILSRLDITSVDKETPVLRITYRSAVPEKAADLVNALAQVYMEDYLETKYKVANTTVDFIGKQLQTVGRSLAGSENSVAGYRDTRRIVNIDQQTDTDLHKVAELKLQRATLDMSLSAAEDVYRQMQAGHRNVLDLAPSFAAFSDNASGDIVRKMKDLQAERRDLLVRFTPEDEKVQALDQKLSDLNDHLLESVRNTRNTLVVKRQQLDVAIGQAEQVFTGLPDREKDLAVLERNRQLNEKLYTFLHEKETEARIAQATPSSSHRIIATGMVPQEPIAPNPVLIYTVAGLLGLIAGVVLVYVLDTARATPQDTLRLQRNTRLPVAAALPLLPEPQMQLAYFRQLVTRLELKGLLRDGAKVVVTDFTGSEGQAFFFRHLSAALAEQGRRFRSITLQDRNSLNPDALPNEVVLVRNLPLDADSHSLAVMAGADVNLVVVDSHRTPLTRLAELEQLMEEYNLPNVQCCLNREGYRPGFLACLWPRLAVAAPASRRADVRAGAPATA